MIAQTCTVLERLIIVEANLKSTNSLISNDE